MDSPSTKLSCKNCGYETTVSASIVSYYCNNCGDRYWGYNHLLELPLSKESLYGLLKLKKELDQIEKNWLKLYSYADQGSLVEDSKNNIRITKSIFSEENFKLTASNREMLDNSNNSELGWLIIKTEGKEHLDYPLLVGENYIGRPTESSIPDVAIVEDPYISRYHAVLTIILEFSSDKMFFVLTDNANNCYAKESESQLKEQSLNGCYLNGDENRLREEEEWILSDGDTIQIGETKLVFKKKKKNEKLKDLKTEVFQQNFEKTILVPEKKAKLSSSSSPSSPGWLIVNMENREFDIHPLYIGENIIGRKPEARRKSIVLTEDPYISRFHAVLTVNQISPNEYVFQLEDNSRNPNNKPSKFGCYRNGNFFRLRKDEKWVLNDGDAIQFGTTKTVLKTREIAGTKEDAVLQVQKRKIEITIPIQQYTR